MHLVDLAADPGILGRKVYLVAEDLAHVGIRAQRVECGGDDGGLGFLVVEEDEGGDCHGDYENGEGFQDGGMDEGRDALALLAFDSSFL